MKNIACIIIPFLISFFPAYLGYDSSLAWIGYTTTICFAMACFRPLVRDTGKRGIFAIMILGIFGYIIESIGVLTCFPYGCFSYSEQLGPKMFNIVPWMLFFTWSPLVIGVWSYISRFVQQILPNPPLTRREGYILVFSTFSLVLVDLILDPIAVSMGLRSYSGGGFRFGVPWTNFAGWVVSGAIGMSILSHIYKDTPLQKSYHHGLLSFLGFFVGWGVWKILFSFF